MLGYSTMPIATRPGARPRALVPLLTLLIVLASLPAPAAGGARRPARADLLSFDELVDLYAHEVPAPALQSKLDALLETPFVDNGAWDRGARPLKPDFPRIGRGLRVLQWNVERGIEYEAIEAALRGAAAFERHVDAGQYPPGSSARANLLEEAGLLDEADVLVLNEVDWGVARTEYRNVAADLAAALGMNYAFGVEFVEVDPVTIGSEELEELTEAEREALAKQPAFDRARTRGLHGTAILSRYRLENVRIHRFAAEGHDWYADEKNGISDVEKGKRKAGEAAFLEKVSREVRRGGRMALVADIVDEELPGGRATVVATHIENRAKPSLRVEQLEELLALVRGVRHAVVLAGDMNTTGSDSTPTSVRYMIKRKLGSKSFWTTRALTSATGFGLVLTAPLGLFGYFNSYRDPTRRGIPLLSPNREKEFFDTLEDFRFADGGRFDFRGDGTRSSNGLSGTLANSNERASKGFATTWRTERTIGPSGKMKLDWIFVKPATGGRGRSSYRFAPHYGRTLKELNYSVADRISDHNPILVDLPFGEPGDAAPALERP